MRGLSPFGPVSLARVVHEHRRWLLPLALVLLANVGVFVAVVLPLSRAASTSEQRAAAARQSLAAAERELKAAEATRDSQSTATRELETFYHEVLPKDFRSAARLTHVRLAQLAEKHGVRYERMSASPERERDSSLEHLVVAMDLSGPYESIRAFLHELETAPEFVVIDNMVLSDPGESVESGLTLSLQLSTYYLAAGANGG